MKKMSVRLVALAGGIIGVLLAGGAALGRN
jgi:hypothetical protein